MKTLNILKQIFIYIFITKSQKTETMMRTQKQEQYVDFLIFFNFFCWVSLEVQLRTGRNYMKVIGRRQQVKIGWFITHFTPVFSLKCIWGSNSTGTKPISSNKNRLISRNSEVSWPPRSCDLIPLDYVLWFGLLLCGKPGHKKKSA